MVGLVYTASSKRSMPVDPVEAYIILRRYVNDSKATALQREQAVLDEALEAINKLVTPEKDDSNVRSSDDN